MVVTRSWDPAKYNNPLNNFIVLRCLFFNIKVAIVNMLFMTLIVIDNFHQQALVSEFPDR